MLRVGSLCSGYAGVELALEMVLGEVDLAFFAEIDKGACKILEHRFPEVPNLGDITKIDWETMKPNYKLDAAQKAEAVKMYDAGLSIGDVASYFGVTRQGMWDILRRRTTMRPQLRFGEDNHFYRGGRTADDRAQNITEWAVAKGILTRPETCQECRSPGTMYKDGRAGIQGHHPDYNKPLDVMWLCKSCHHKWHEENTAVPVRGGDADENRVDVNIDILTAGFP